ncbi:hypothetical protein ZHAS_00000971 [Anopheles sinensis]|uniref:Uncharacterized protein n=1 Tax=Anopheles sinensis TaxID=74873 RepID=A0A084VAT6_ANOSI|nr:hypothetical protein ZHAS_00000971 [Anopheles sinensis]
MCDIRREYHRMLRRVPSSREDVKIELSPYHDALRKPALSSVAGFTGCPFRQSNALVRSLLT